MALTRPQNNDEFLIELLLPGGIRLGANRTFAPHAPESERPVLSSSRLVLSGHPSRGE